MEGRPSAAPTLHMLRVRTAEEDVWEVNVRAVQDVELAVRLAYTLRAFLAQPVTDYTFAPRWAFEIRASIERDKADPATCVVEVARIDRGWRTRWRVIAEFDVSDDEADGVAGRVLQHPCRRSD